MTKALTLQQKFNKRWIPEPNSGCWLWLGNVYNTGYGTFSWSKRKRMTAHRYSWILHKGPIPDGMLVCHKCDVRCCVNPAHLFLGTDKDNMYDCITKGRHKSPPILNGMANGFAKLTDANIMEIRQSTCSQRQLAKYFNVSQTLIGMVKRKEIWKHIQ